MKKRQVTALLLAAVMAFGTCVPMGSITALAAETGAAGETAAAAEPEGETAEAYEQADQGGAEIVSAEGDEQANDIAESDEQTNDVAEGEEQAEQAIDAAEPAEDSGQDTAEAAEDTKEEEESAGAAAETDVAADYAGSTDEADDASDEADPADASQKEAGTQDAATLKTDESVTEEDPAKEPGKEPALASSPDDFSDAQDIALGDRITVEVTDDNPYTVLRFAPEETGKYTFYSTDSADGFDPYAELYNEYAEYLAGDDDGGEYNDFSLGAILEVGETYYLSVGKNSTDSGTTTICLEKPDFYVDKESYYISAEPGETVNLNAGASSSEPITYEWHQVTEEDDQIIEGQNSDTLVWKADRVETIYCIVGSGENIEQVYFYISIENGLEVSSPDGTMFDMGSYRIEAKANEQAALHVNVSANNTSGITYSWYTDGEMLEETSNTLVTPPVTQSCSYSCYVQDAYGNMKEIYFYVNVQNDLAAYAGGTKDQIVELSAAPGDKVPLSVDVEALDKDGIRYQWSKDWTEIEGETASSIEIGPLTEAVTVTCDVYDKYSNHVSVEFDIRVENHFNAYPKGESKYTNYRDIQASVVDKPELSVIVEADDLSKVTYSWSDDDGPLEETSNTYVTSISDKVENYYCYVHDGYGNTETITFSVYYTNNLKIDSERDYIIVQPGDSAELKAIVQADDDSQLQFKWLNSKDEEIAGAYTSSYTVANIRESTNYYCIVSDQYGEADTAYFHVVVGNHLILNRDGRRRTSSLDVQKRERIQIDRGEEVTLSAAAYALDEEDLTFAWYKSEGEETLGTGRQITVKPEYDDTYTCEVEDKFGNSKYISFIIEVNGGVSFEAYGEEENPEVEPGGSAVLKVITNAVKPEDVQYQWSKDYGDEKIEGETSSELTLKDIQEGGNYCCTVKYGDMERRVYFDLGINHFEAYPEGAEKFKYGYSSEVRIDIDKPQAVTLRAIVNADDKSGITYSWEGPEIEEADSETLEVYADRSSNYTCWVNDQYGNRAMLNFDIRLGKFEVYPEGAEIEEGSEHNLYADVHVRENEKKTLRIITDTTSKELRYEWKRINEPIPGGTNTIEITGKTNETYDCTVSDAYGNSTDISFNVYVNDDVPDLAPIEKTVKYGETVRLEIPQALKDRGVTSARWSGLSNTNYWVGRSLSEGPYCDYDTSDIVAEMPPVEVKYDQEKGMLKAYIRAAGYDKYENYCKASYYLYIDNALTAVPADKDKYPYDSAQNLLTINGDKGENVTLRTAASADKGKLFYSWQCHDLDASFSGGNVPEDGWTYLGSKTDSLDVTLDGAKRYECVVEDEIGTYAIAAFNVVSGKILTDTDVAVASGTFTYNGKAHTPAVTVTFGGKKLTAGTDYTTAYADNVNAGTASVTVTGTGDYEGTITKNFTIGKAAQTLTCTPGRIAVGKSVAVTVKGAKTALTCTSSNKAVAVLTSTAANNEAGRLTVKGVKAGNVNIVVKAAETQNYKAASKTFKAAIVPAATAKITIANLAKGIKVTWAKVPGATGYLLYRNNTLIKKTTSGTAVTWTDTAANTNGTKYTYKVIAFTKGVGNSTLSKTCVAYRVARPAITSIKNSASRKMTLKWGKNAKATGYQIQYSLKSNFAGAKTVNVTKAATVTKVIGSLTKGKVYYVRIRTCKKVGKTTYYSMWSVAKKLKIAK